jgi:hypothetical protein
LINCPLKKKFPYFKRIACSGIEYASIFDSFISQKRLEL